MKQFHLSMLLAVLINVLSVNTVKGEDLIQSYDIHLEINPQDQMIFAEIILELDLSKNKHDTLVFYLHKELSIISIKPDQSLSFNFLKEQECPYFYMRNARPLQIIPKQENNEKAIIHIKYQGLIKEIAWNTTNMLTPDWIELGNYSAWFPYNPEYGDFIYKIQLNIEDSYKVSGTGKIRKRDDGIWEIVQDCPAGDIVLIASRDLKSKVYVEDQYQVRIDYVFIKDEKVEELAEDAKFILHLYTKWFHSGSEQYTIVIVPPFPDRGSYFREGFIALLQPMPGMESDIPTYKLLAHEFAHNWWSHAETNNWEDWLNESFAEYSCLMAIREKYGREVFNEWIDFKALASNYAEPVVRYGNNERTSYGTRYHKGPIALYHLETRLGNEDFIELLKTINECSISTTDELLEKIENYTSRKVREEFELILAN